SLAEIRETVVTKRRLRENGNDGVVETATRGDEGPILGRAHAPRRRDERSEHEKPCNTQTELYSHVDLTHRPSKKCSPLATISWLPPSPLGTSSVSPRLSMSHTTRS